MNTVFRWLHNHQRLQVWMFALLAINNFGSAIFYFWRGADIVWAWIDLVSGTVLMAGALNIARRRSRFV